MNRKLGTAIAGAVILVAGAGVAAGAAAATGNQLVYICQDTQGHTSTCRNSQEFEVFDKNGAPIFSVGEAGGPGTFGDNSSVYSPSNIFRPALVNSYTSPGVYNKTFGRPNTCKAPEVWFEPQAIWTCTSKGTWQKKISL